MGEQQQKRSLPFLKSRTKKKKHPQKKGKVLRIRTERKKKKKKHRRRLQLRRCGASCKKSVRSNSGKQTNNKKRQIVERKRAGETEMESRTSKYESCVPCKFFSRFRHAKRNDDVMFRDEVSLRPAWADKRKEKKKRTPTRRWKLESSLKKKKKP